MMINLVTTTTVILTTNKDIVQKKKRYKRTVADADIYRYDRKILRLVIKDSGRPDCFSRNQRLTP